LKGGENMASRLLSVKEVAETLGVTVDTVQRWLAAGKLKGIKLGRLWRVRSADLEKFLKEGGKKNG